MRYCACDFISVCIYFISSNEYVFLYMDLVLVTLLTLQGGGGGGGGAGWHLNIYINNAKDVNDKYP